ncbi:Protein of unknown function, partial [Gryllus bimaculatus]
MLVATTRPLGNAIAGAEPPLTCEDPPTITQCLRDEGDAEALEAAASAEMPAQAELRIVDSQSLLLRWPLVEGAIGYE